MSKENGKASKSSSDNTNRNDTNNKKRKSPFRIRIGNLVVTRTPPPNVVPSHWISVFVPPPPTLLQSIHTLIGTRVRCQVRKTSSDHNRIVGSGGGEEQTTTATKFVTGHIVKVLAPHQPHSTSSSCLVVEVLLDDAAKAMGLNRVDTTTMMIGGNTTTTTTTRTQPSQSELRRIEYEKRIQGINTAVVQVRLTNGNWVVQTFVPTKKWVESSTTTTTTCKGAPLLLEPQQPQESGNNNEGDHEEPMKANNTNNDNNNNNNSKFSNVEKKKKKRTTTTMTLHIGDSNDSDIQQTNNWRFLASRFPRIWNDIGQVLSVDVVDRRRGKPSCSTSDTTANSKNNKNNNHQQQDNDTTSLAMVTIRPLVWPEQTRNGRQLFHRTNEAFIDADCPIGQARQYPIESLIQVAKNVAVSSSSSNHRGGIIIDEHDDHIDNDDQVVVTLQYSRRHNLFAPIGIDIDPEKPHCHRCRIIIIIEGDADGDEQEQVPKGHRNNDWWCQRCWVQTGCSDTHKSSSSGSNSNNSTVITTTTTRTTKTAAKITSHQHCDCPRCRDQRDTAARFALRAALLSHTDAVSALQSITTPVHFTLPFNFLDPWPLPSHKPCTKLLVPLNKKTNHRTTRKDDSTANDSSTRTTTNNNKRPRGRKRPRQVEDSIAEPGEDEEPPEDYSFFRPTCARLDVPNNNTNNKKFRRRTNRPSSAAAFLSLAAEKPRNVRDLQVGRLLTELPTPSSTTKPSRRAMRWNQRRLEQVVGRTNTLASKEAFLRFGRSKIHAWGVFAEKPIEADELIIEYRGELIGNAVAEREIEYARSLGRDYMFRIDADQVCDATKQGNVARFINASCEPNCYTKIITFDGAKRIAIYAKRDISEGEELSYDYKFEPEYDPAKRIPCNCMAKECRGFMNWDRRYVTVPRVPNDVTPDDTSLEQSSEGGDDGGGDVSSCPVMRQVTAVGTKYSSPKALPRPPPLAAATTTDVN